MSNTSPSASVQPDLSGRFDVGGGRMMYLECHGTGSPTVVLVAGQRGSADDWALVSPGVGDPPVLARVARTTRVCAYDRPGTPVGEQPSRSDPVPQPADAASMVSDLHALLAAADVAGPIVLVGHSAGGLVARLYTSTHPDEVAGLVLVDALSEVLQDSLTAEQWSWQKPLLRGDIDASIAQYPALEWVDAERSFAEMRAAAPPKQLPLAVIAADHPIAPTFPALKAAGTIAADIPDAYGAVLDAVQAQSQRMQADLVPGALFVANTDSGHNVHQEQPALVADVIDRIVTRVREGAVTAVG